MSYNMTVKGSKLTIEIDLAAKTEVSKSGKSDIIASTGGFAAVPGAPDVKVGLNVIKKRVA